MHLIWHLLSHRMFLLKQSFPLIFTYHSIASKFHVGLNVVHPDVFNSHVRFIAKINNSNKNNQIVLAFDDGYESVITNAFPIMEEYGQKGIVFPITGFIGKSNDWDVTFGINKEKHLTETQILFLSENGWEIGCHGHSHRSFKWLQNKEIKDELNISKSIIEDITGKVATSFCLPFGDITQEATKFIEESGFINLYMQLPLFKKKIFSQILRFQYSRAIYATDRVKSLENKYNYYYREHLKESFIHSFSTATVIVKEML